MNITPMAEEKIAQTLQDSELLRIEVSGGGCSGFTVGLAKVIDTDERDIWVRENVVMDTTSEVYLSEAILDWKDDAFNSTFHFKIPKTKSCGCGDSFQFEDA
jgi:iron-sulfur cluster insertion protein|tara:strand:+ start:255 stop:560 length:306 start_codon:yes stop_codon:yes gene_type:complete